MLFSIQDLEFRKIHFDVVFPPGEIDFLDDDLSQSGDLAASGVVELFTKAIGEIRVKGNLRVAMHTPCDRCLEPAELAVDTPFDLFYRPSSMEPDAEEVRLEGDETEVGYYEGQGLELGDIVREVVILAVPMRHLCREACKGICPVCGGNRNQTDCQCEVRASDDRWTALQQLMDPGRG